MKKVLVVLLNLLTFAGCSAHPITDAVCVSQCLDSLDTARVLVWTNEAKIQPLLIAWVRKQGGEVIDSVIAQDTMGAGYLEARSEQEIERSLRQLARAAGANRVLVGFVERRSYPVYNLYSGYKEGHPRVTTLFDPTVTLRSINVDEGTIQWSVTAKGGSTSFVYDPLVTELTETALERAACEADINTRWTDARRCIPKA